MQTFEEAYKNKVQEITELALSVFNSGANTESVTITKDGLTVTVLKHRPIGYYQIKVDNVNMPHDFRYINNEFVEVRHSLHCRGYKYDK